MSVFKFHKAASLIKAFENDKEIFNVAFILADFADYANLFRSKQLKMPNQLNDFLNSKGERLVFALNKLLNDCECSKPKA